MTRALHPSLLSITRPPVVSNDVSRSCLAHPIFDVLASFSLSFIMIPELSCETWAMVKSSVREHDCDKFRSGLMYCHVHPRVGHVTVAPSLPVHVPVDFDQSCV
jgi:hypothetical protein